MSLLAEARLIAGRPSGAAKRALTYFWRILLRALHESRRREAERVIHRYRDLIDRNYASSMENRTIHPSTPHGRRPT